MKVVVEVSHLAEVASFIEAVDRHRVGACLVLVGVVVVAGLALLAWYLLRA